MVTTLIGIALLAAQTTVHVDGDGFLRFVRDGRFVYSKEADLTVANGRLVQQDGYEVSPRLTVNGTPSAIRVDLEGYVFGTYSGTEQEIGRMVLAIFPDNVRPVVENGFVVSSFRLKKLADPGSVNAGVIREGKPGKATAPKALTTPTATSDGTIRITLHETAEVIKDTFTLGDIADVTADAATKSRLEAIEISNTPALSGVYRMSHSMVTGRMLRFDKKADEYEMVGATQVAVSRKGQTITHEQLVIAAIASAKQDIGENAVLKATNNLQPFIAPIGDLELVGERVSSNGSRVSVTVAIFVDGKRFNSRTVQLENHDPISKLRNGQNVKVIVRSNAAMVQTTGKIVSIDHRSNTVLVKTVTGAELIGTVTDINTVEVRL